jgi:hypothetical protein
MMDGYRSWAGELGCVYQGVDSLHCTPAGVAQLCGASDLIGPELGQLAWKGAYNDAIYYGPNYYRLDEKWYAAGRTVDARPVGSHGWAQTVRSGLEHHLATSRDPSLAAWEQVCMPHPLFARGTIRADGWVDPVNLDWNRIDQTSWRAGNDSE